MRRESAFCLSRHLAWRSLCFCGYLRNPACHSAVDAADGIGDPGAGTCGTEQPAEIGARPASHCVDGGKRENDHHGRHFRCDIRLGDQHLQQFSECGAGYAPPDCNTRRNEEGYAVPRRAAVVVSGAARRVEGQHRPVPRRCCNRRVYRGKRGAWLSDYLRQSGVQICTRKRREDDR